MKFSHSLLLLFCLGWVTGLSAQVTELPFQPEQLLATLPDTPRDWTLVRSDADLFLGDALLSKATRVFWAPTKPLNASDTPPPPPGEVKIRILDTAGDVPSLADFADFKPAKNGSIERKFIGSLPAIVFGGDETKQVTQVLVSSRYILDVTFTNLPQQRVEDWLRSLHFNRLPEKSEGPPAPTGQFRLSYVDELHPEKNRSYNVAATDRKRLNEILKASHPGGDGR
jgi:hypothetical protein